MSNGHQPNLKKGLRVVLNPVSPCFYLVPEDGIEPSLPRGKGDFESPASTSFTTPARRRDYDEGVGKCQEKCIDNAETLMLLTASVLHG